MMIITMILGIVIIFCITFFLRQRSKYPPGPFPWPIIGNQYYLEKLSHQLGGQHLAFSELSKIYNNGIIKLRLGINDVIVVMDSKLIEEICISDEYTARPWNQFEKLRNMGMKKGITMNDGNEWKVLRTWSVRSLKSVGFAKQKMIDLINEEITLIVAKLGNGGVQQIRPIISPATINVLWTLVTGKRLSNNTSRLQKIMDLMERRALLFDMSGGLISSLPWLRYIAPEMSGYNVLVALNNELKSFIMEIIKEHKERYVKGNEADFIDMFLSEMYSEKKKDKDNIFSDDNLLMTLIDLFIASSDSSPPILDMIFLQMVNYQEVQCKLHKEIDTVIGPSRLPHFEDRVKMPYTQAILTECQRRWSITPLINRRALSDMILGGYHIPKDTMVLINMHSNNMNPEFFPDPMSFRPERFINEDGAYVLEDNMMTFGKGKRKCLGEALGRSAVFLLFVGVMQKYRLLPEPGKKFINFDTNSGLTVLPKPYKMLIVPRLNYI